MTKQIVGALATVALLGSGMALAGDTQHKAQVPQPMGQDVYGGSGTAREQQPAAHAADQALHGQAMGDEEISGTVLKRSGNELTLRTENGVIAVKINKDTKFQDATLKRVGDIKEGQQVRTSYTVDKGSHVARTVMLDPGMGGSGLDTVPGINQGLDTQDQNPEGHHDLNQGMAPGLDVNAPGTKAY